MSTLGAVNYVQAKFESKDFVFALAKTLKPTTTIANQTKEERESGLERERERVKN